MKNTHKYVEENETELSDTETELSESERDHGMSESDEASDTERQSGREHYDPWDSVIERAFDKCQDQFEKEVAKMIRKRKISETGARRHVYQDMQSTYRKAVINIFTKRMVWFDEIRRHPVYKTIKKTATNFIDLEDYNPEEAWKSAIGKRKYIFDNILEEYYPPELEEEELEEGDISDIDNDEPPAKKVKA